MLSTAPRDHRPLTPTLSMIVVDAPGPAGMLAHTMAERRGSPVMSAWALALLGALSVAAQAAPLPAAGDSVARRRSAGRSVERRRPHGRTMGCCRPGYERHVLVTLTALVSQS